MLIKVLHGEEGLNGCAPGTNGDLKGPTRVDRRQVGLLHSHLTCTPCCIQTGLRGHFQLPFINCWPYLGGGIWGTPSGTNSQWPNSWLFVQGSLLVVPEELFEMLGIEPETDSCRQGKHTR